MKNGLRFAWVIVFVALLAVKVIAVEDPSYVLTPWPYGAIAWVGFPPSDCQSRSRRLAEAVDNVFSLWELPALSPMAGWEDPSKVERMSAMNALGSVPQMRKKDPNTQKLWRLNPLSWEEVEIYSLLYIAFPSRILMAQALGTTSIGGVWIPGNWAYRGSEVWFQSLTGVPMSIVAPSQDADIVAWHEIAHWMTYLVCERDSVPMGALPEFIIEGIAEYTASTLVGIPGWKHEVAVWAEQNALSLQMDPWATYEVGRSVVTYLVETKGPSEFLHDLPHWALHPHVMLRNTEPAWREWLGLESSN